jgi:hypothetical protein
VEIYSSPSGHLTVNDLMAYEAPHMFLTSRVEIMTYELDPIARSMANEDGPSDFTVTGSIAHREPQEGVLWLQERREVVSCSKEIGKSTCHKGRPP